MSSSLNPTASRRLVVVLIFIATCFTAPSAALATTNIPSQYIAHMYTEALGRAPDASGWSSWTNYYTTNGCHLATLQDMGIGTGSFFNSNSSFTDANPDAQSQVVAMYRAILNRDPDTNTTTASGYITALKNGTMTILQVATALYNSSEFGYLANGICGTYTNDSSYPTSTYIADYNNPALPPDPSNPEFPVGVWPAYPTTPLTCGGTTCYHDFSSLQTALNAATSGTIYLAPESVIRATATLTVPAGVTLATYNFNTTNNSNTSNYTQMGRIVRTGTFTGPLIQLSSGSTLEWVWVDGQRNLLNYNGSNGSINVSIPQGSSGTVVRYNRIMEPQGGAGLIADGWGNGLYNGNTIGCSNLQITGNLFTGYATTHTKQVTNGVGATATAIVSGGQVTGITMVSGGSGYVTGTLPYVVFNSGGGRGASATAVVSGGQVTNITGLVGGSGYTNGFTVAFTASYAIADAMDIQCEDATVSGNYLVDVTDTGVTLWGSVSTEVSGKANHPQHSLVENNTVIQAGNSINAIFNADPISGLDQPANATASNNWNVTQWSCYSGAQFNTNTMWTSQYAPAIFGLTSGDQAFFPSDHPMWMGSCPDGTGPQFSDNSTPSGLSLYALQAYTLQGMAYTTIHNGETLNIVAVPASSIPLHTPGYACPPQSGSPTFTYYKDAASVVYSIGNTAPYTFVNLPNSLFPNGQVVNNTGTSLGTPTTSPTDVSCE